MKRTPRVSYVLQDSNASSQSHCFGVNAVAISSQQLDVEAHSSHSRQDCNCTDDDDTDTDQHRILYTAGRDASIRFWKCSGKRLKRSTPQPQETEEICDGHESEEEDEGGEEVYEGYRRDDGGERGTDLENLADESGGKEGRRASQTGRDGVYYPSHLHCFNLHTDWVNDLKLCCNESVCTFRLCLLVHVHPCIVNKNTTVASCSSDTTVILWSTATGRCSLPNVRRSAIATLKGHSDYVKALAVAQRSHILVSAGLDKCVCIWDLCHNESPACKYAEAADVSNGYSAEIKEGEGVTVPRSWGMQMHKKNMIIDKRRGHKESIYCVDINAEGNVIASGSTDTVVRGWDTRSGRQSFKLKGHMDNIRCLCLDSSGTKLLSGSSDATVKLWDLGQQRCVQTFQCHTDSVWALSATNSFSKLYSGGRDRRVFCSDLMTTESKLVVEEESPILSVHLLEEDDTVWTTSRSYVREWTLSSTAEESYNSFSYATTPTSLSNGTAAVAKPVSRRLVSEVKQRPALVKFHILNDRRNVLTCDSEGEIQRWDVTKGEMVEAIEREKDNEGRFISSWEDVIKARFDLKSIPNWFTIDLKTGSLCVHMTYPTCFSATVEAGSAEFFIPESCDTNTKVNLGERVLNCLFGKWLEKNAPSLETKSASEDGHKGSVSESSNSKTTVTPSTTTSSGNNKGNDTDTDRNETVKNDDDTNCDQQTNSKNDVESATRPNKSNKLPPSRNETPSLPILPSHEKGHPKPFLHLPPETRIVVSDGNTSAPLVRSRLSELSGKETLPPWVKECLLESSFVSREVEKYNFVLLPNATTDLPELSISGRRLSAHRLLKVRRVAHFLVDKLHLVVVIDRGESDFVDLKDSGGKGDGLRTDNKDKSNINNGNSNNGSSSAKNKDDDAVYHDCGDSTTMNGASVTGDGEKAVDALLTPEDAILFSCRTHELREDIDLAAVKTFFWKSGDDIALHYTLRKGWWFKPPHYLVRSNSPPSYSSSSSSASSLDCNGHTS